MTTEKIHVSSFIDSDAFNKLSMEEKQLESQLFLTHLLGVIQGIAFASAPKLNYVLNINLTILDDLERKQSNKIIEILKSKEVVITILLAGTEDGLFLG